MDPNQTLHEIRELSGRLQNRTAFAEPWTSTTDMLMAGRRLAELVDALDRWLISAGFLPDAWTRCPDCGQSVVGPHSHLSDRPDATDWESGDSARPDYVHDVSPGGTSNGELS
jgi:hypothetical protein